MYLDPGFGSMLIQIIVASLAAGGAMLAIFRSKIASMFKKQKVDDTPLNVMGETPSDNRDEENAGL